MTSWIAAGVIGLIIVITVLRVLLWIYRNIRRRRGSSDINPPLVEHDHLSGNDQSKNVSSYGGYDDDEKPLSP